MLLQPFDENDLAAFAGAEGTNPLINYTQPITLDGVVYNNTTIVVDDNGLEFYVLDENLMTVAVWQWHTNHQTAKAAAENMDWLNLTQTGLFALGFEIVA